MRMKELTTYQHLWIRLETQAAEGLAVPGYHDREQKNAAGRPVHFAPSGELAFIAGISAGGLRAAAWTGQERTAADSQTLAQALRNLQPLVVVAGAGQSKALAATGAFALYASTVQELLDFTLIAHRVSELALVPGIVLYQIEEEEEQAVIPAGRDIWAFLGDPDDRIPSPSPAQQMLFGKTRRRIPRMFNPDVAVLAGAKKSTGAMAYEGAAHAAYFKTHLDAFFFQAFEEFEKHFGRKYRSYHAENAARAELLLFSDNARATNLASSLHSKYRLGTVILKQWSPLPSALAGLAEKARSVAVVERATENGGALFPSLCEAFAGKPIALHSALYAKAPAPESIQAFLDRLENGTLGASPFWLDIAFSREHSAFPKRQVLLEHIRREYPHLDRQSAQAGKSPAAQPVRMPERVPLALRRYKDHGPVYARLSNFFDQTAFFYDAPNPDWVADPFQAFPVMPPASAGFGRAAAARTHIPTLDTAACTGCGDCFVHCPHAAIPPIALDVEAFLHSGIQQARAKGQVIAQIVPHVKNLAKAANKVVTSYQTQARENGQSGNADLSLGDILAPAFEEFVKQAKLEGDKLDNISREFNAVAECIGAFRVVMAGAFFNDAAKSLFSLAIDPNACTGCGICVEVCPERALHLSPDNGAQKEALHRQFALWEQLPDTQADTMQRLLDDPGYPSTAALMLSRNFYMSITGATQQDSDPAKTMIHIATAIAEAAVQPGFRALLKEIEDKSGLISTRLKTDLSEALPDTSSDGLAERLQQITSERVSIEELLNLDEGHAPQKLLDKAAMLRKTELLKELGNLKSLIESGAGGMGRARYGIVLDASLAEMAGFPLNSFTVPVICFDGASVEMAQGLIHAHLRHVLDNVKVLRRATIEADNKYNPAIHDAEIAALRWEDLSEAEKAFASPLLLIARPQLLYQQGSSALAQLLEEGLPVKFIILDDANPPASKAASDILYSTASILSFIGLRHVQVLQSSLAHPGHLFEGLISAFGKPGSAFIRLLAPAGARGHMQRMHELAHNSRAFPHLDYRPERQGSLLFSKLHIDRNPAPDAEWLSDMLYYSEGGEEKQVSYELSRADWAWAQPDRQRFFEPWQERMGEAVPVAAYLRLQIQQRKGKIPVIFRIGAAGELVYYTVGEVIIRETEAAMQAWALLREIAGTLAEFPEKVYAKAEKELRAQFEADKQRLADDYEARLKKTEQEHLDKIRLQMREKLLRMAGVK